MAYRSMQRSQCESDCPPMSLYMHSWLLAPHYHVHYSSSIIINQCVHVVFNLVFFWFVVNQAFVLCACSFERIVAMDTFVGCVDSNWSPSSEANTMSKRNQDSQQTDAAAVVPTCMNWSVEEVADWVESLGFPQYRVR